MDDALRNLLSILALKKVSDRSFSGLSSGHDEFGLFGGHQLAQGIAAAYETVSSERILSSVHALFLRPGNGSQAIKYEVESIRDGRSFTQRRVRAMQEDRNIFELTASFQAFESSERIISPDFPAGVKAPELLPTFEECIERVGPIFGEQWSTSERPVEYRVEHAPWAPAGPSDRGGINFWFKTKRKLDDNASIHSSILAYMSDDCVSDTLLVPFNRTWGTEGTMVVSLDHSMWFHRPARADEWIYVEQWPSTAYGSRGLAHARIWQDGHLVSSVAQEALLRF